MRRKFSAEPPKRNLWPRADLQPMDGRGFEDGSPGEWAAGWKTSLDLAVLEGT